jgi:hypothetical protein
MVIHIMWQKLVTGAPVPGAQRVEEILVPKGVLYVGPEPMIHQTSLLVLAVLAFNPVNGVFRCACESEEAFTKLIPKRARKDFPFLQHGLSTFNKSLPLDIVNSE